ncbi:hypothetical protein R1flu_014881 [Riccia fluitans]|uniref:Ycf49-like protein n=1 Tax=Riccia fluitans TaxID=41844 RepID=A0ABD1YHR0_9MARC
MAARLASIFGTEKALVNRSLCFKVSECRHKVRCSGLYIRPTIAPTLSLSKIYQRPDMATPDARPNMNPRRVPEHVEDVDRDIYQEPVRSGEQESLNACENLGDHMEFVAHSLKSILAGLGAEEMLVLGLMARVLLFPEQSWAVDIPTVAGTTTEASQGLMSWANSEPANALSLPTWIIHVASVAEWVTAMSLVWKYGDTPGKSAWKGLTWGMVPLLGGAMCACTWHFFYNAPSLEVLVVLQAFLTVVGNFTMWIAAYRIWRSSQEKASVK